MTMLRKTILKNCLLLVIAAVTLALPSCSKEDVDRRADLIALTSADDVLTIATEPSRVLKSAGFTVEKGKIVASDKLRGLKGTEDLVEVINTSGLDYHSCVISGGENRIYFLAAIDNKSAFTGSLKDKDFKAETIDGLEIYEGSDGSFVINKDVAIYLPAKDAAEAAAQAKAVIDAAARNPRPQWQIERLAEANDVNIMISVAQIAELAASADKEAGALFKSMMTTDAAYSFATFNFDGPTLKCKNEYLNESGSRTDFTDPSKITPLSRDILALGNGQQMFAAFSIPEGFKNYFAAMGLKSPETDAYFDALRAFAFIGSVKGANFMSPDNYSVAFTLSFDPAIRETVSTGLDNLADMASSVNAKASREGDLLTVTTEYNRIPLTLYAKLHDDYIVMTNSLALTEKPSGSSPVSGDIYSYADIDLPKDGVPLSLAGCPFGIHIAAHADLSEGEATVTLTDTDGGFIENIITFASRF